MRTQVEVLGGDGLVAHVTGHLLAREHATRILRHADGARHVVRTAVAVRGALRAEVVALDGAGVALADGGALHVHLLADGEHLGHGHAAPAAYLPAMSAVDAEFLDDFTGFDARLGEVAGFGLVTREALREPNVTCKAT
jgi:hypothetical protein